ncbi:MAG: transglycosylase domain-containing protein [Bacteroidales bacterium]
MKLKINSKQKRILILLAACIVSVFMLLMVFILAIRSGYFGSLPTLDQLQKIEQNNASKVISSDGKLLGLYYHENRTNTKIGSIPQALIDGLIATEDIRFYQHTGFDNRSFFRVLIKSVLLFDRKSGGGSTISQQLAKNLFPRKNRGLFYLVVDKVKEIMTARRLEKIYSKEQILELYLNTVSFGENTYGIETASLTYFRKTPQELTITESALLVGMLKASTDYNPRLYEEAAYKRRNTVIDRMVKYGAIDKSDADSLKLLPVELQFNKLDHVYGPAPYFREFLRREVTNILAGINEVNGTSYNIYTDGLTIHTTINAALQKYAEESVKEQLTALQKLFDRQWRNQQPWKKNPTLAHRQIEQSIPFQRLRKNGVSDSQILDSLRIPHSTKVFSWSGELDTILSSLDSILYHFGILQSGMLAVDGRSGNVLAWVGGPDYRYFKYDHVLASRQVGSTIKPLIYASAIDQGLNPCDFFPNDSITYPEFDDWTPRNANNRYGGYYSVQGALVHSVNTVSVQLLMEAGIAHTIRKLQQVGISAPLPEVPSLALGSAEIPLYQMVQAYSLFLNEGLTRPLRFIEKILDAEGNVIYEQPENTTTDPVFSEMTTRMVQAMLTGVVSRGTASGLRSNYNLSNEMGGKTGTTQNQADGWFIGMTPDLIVGVWIGGASPLVRFRDSGTGSGSRTAMPVFARFMKKLSHDREYAPLLRGGFNIPDEIYAQLNCDDFRETTGFLDFLNIKRDNGIRSIRQRDRSDQKNDEEKTKMGRFLKRVFGKKDEH